MKTKLKTPSNAAVNKQTDALVHYGAMCREIAICQRVDEVKSIRDKAMALSVYAKQALNTEAEKQALSIRMRAERRAGEMLRAMKQSGERHGKGQSKVMSETPTLQRLHISRDQSSQWQKLSAVPEKKFETYLRDNPHPTTEGLLLQQEKPEGLQP